MDRKTFRLYALIAIGLSLLAAHFLLKHVSYIGGKIKGVLFQWILFDYFIIATIALLALGVYWLARALLIDLTIIANRDLDYKIEEDDENGNGSGETADKTK